MNKATITDAPKLCKNIERTLLSSKYKETENPTKFERNVDRKLFESYEVKCVE